MKSQQWQPKQGLKDDSTFSHAGVDEGNPREIPQWRAVGMNNC